MLISKNYETGLGKCEFEFFELYTGPFIKLGDRYFIVKPIASYNTKAIKLKMIARPVRLAFIIKVTPR